MPALPKMVQFRAYPSIRLLLLACLGAYLSHLLSPGAESLLVISSLSAIFWALAEIWALQSYRTSKNLRSSLYVTTVICIGALYMHFYEVEKSSKQELLQQYVHLEWSQIDIEAKITSFAHASRKWEIEIIRLSNQYEIPVVGLKGECFIEEQELLSTGFKPSKGDRIKATVQVLPASEYTSASKFTGRFKVLMLYDCADSWYVGGLEKLHRRIYANLQQAFEGSSSLQDLSVAMVLGLKSNVSATIRDLFQKVGLSHVLAVSGMHVGMLLLPFWWVIPFFWRKESTKWLFIINCGLLLLFYSKITGSPASVVRASSMAILLIVAKLWRLNSRPMNTLGFIALCLLIITPSSIADIGFQLSFFAVACIFMVFQPIETLIPIKFRWRRAYRFLIGPMLFTNCLQLAMYPLTALYFGIHSMVAPVANLIFLPFLSLMLFPLFILAALLGRFFPEWITLCVDYLLNHFIAILNNMLSLPYAYLLVEGVQYELIVLGIALIIGLNLLSFPKWRWKWLILMLLLLCGFELKELYNL